MLTLTLNPGFVPIIAGLLVLAAPRSWRSPTMGGAAILALWLMLDREFGAAEAMAQMGLPVVPLNLDALNRIFAIALLIALVALSLYTGARRHRFEDAAILMLAGGSISALFVGDLILFVGAAAFAGLASAWTVSASSSEGASRAGARLLIWTGLEGLLFLVGVALHLTAGADSTIIGRLDVTSAGGACIFAALMIRVGAPFAHVWFKDVVSHASPAGGAALSAFSSVLGVYALARLFPGEPLLTTIGAAMVVVGAFYTAAEEDLRRAAAYAMSAQLGVCVALIGVGSPLAMAAAEGHAFACVLAFTALQMSFGAILDRAGSARLSKLEGVARRMPISGLLTVAAGLAVAAAPGFASYATQAVALEASAEWELRWLWGLIVALPAVLFACLVLRPALVLYRSKGPAPARDEAAFPMLLGAGVATFLCISVGLAPRWLYDLMPAELTFQPFALDRVAPQLELLGVAGLVYLVCHLAGLGRPTAGRILDIDALYRGPVASGGRWAGVLLLRVYGAWQALAVRLSSMMGRAFADIAARCDRPFAPSSTANFLQLLSIGALIAVILFFR